MVDILHRVGVRTASPEKVYDALTSVEGLAGWWTEETSGSGAAGGTVEFRFGDKGGFDMDVLEAVPGERVTWRVVDGPEEWVGTTIDWDLRCPCGQASVAHEKDIIRYSEKQDVEDDRITCAATHEVHNEAVNFMKGLDL